MMSNKSFFSPLYIEALALDTVALAIEIAACTSTLANSAVVSAAQNFN